MEYTHTAYKLTDQAGYTRRGATGETLWLPVGSIVVPTGVGSKPCGPGVLHAYIAPEVAMLANPSHANIQNPRLFRIESDRPWTTDGLKRWTTGTCTVVEELPVFVLPVEEVIAWAICLAPHPVTRKWAIGWLSRKDRTIKAAFSASDAARALDEAAWASTQEIDSAARAADSAARAAGWADGAAARAAAARADVAAARAAARTAAARAAAWATAWATAGAPDAALVPTLAHARSILAGKTPAEDYDKSPQ